MYHSAICMILSIDAIQYTKKTVKTGTGDEKRLLYVIKSQRDIMLMINYLKFIIVFFFSSYEPSVCASRRNSLPDSTVQAQLAECMSITSIFEKKTDLYRPVGQWKQLMHTTGSWTSKE